MSFSFDDWSCGVILFAMLTCTLPFSERELRGKDELTLHISSKISEDAVSIFEGLLNPNSTGRMSVSKMLVSSQWLSSERCKKLPETLSTLAMSYWNGEKTSSDCPVLTELCRIYKPLQFRVLSCQTFRLLGPTNSLSTSRIYFGEGVDLELNLVMTLQMI